MVRSYSRGHEIYYTDSWYYKDNNKPIDSKRECKKCNRKPIKISEDSFADACLGFLKNVKSACCGHGIEKEIIMEVE